MTVSAWLSFLSMFFLNQVVLGAVLAAFLLRFTATARLPCWAVALLGVGLAPWLVTLLLYYLLWIFPGIAHAGVFLMLFVVFAGLAWSAGPGWRVLTALPGDVLRMRHDRSLWLFALCTLGYAVLIVVMLTRFALTEHDILEYGVQGGIFLREMAVTYQRHHYDAATGFYYVGLHGFTVPLLFTWEGLVNAHAASMGNPWVRSLTPFYTWLVVALLWGIMRKLDQWAAVWFALALGGAMGFYFLGTVYHLDAMRIFLFVAAVTLFASVLKRPTVAGITLFAAVCAASASIHSLSAMLAGLMAVLMLFLLPLGWKQRLLATGRFALVFLLAGGIHYPVDVFFGTGWIFKDIVWY